MAQDYEAAKAHITKTLGSDLSRPVEEYRGWRFGTRVRILEDNEDQGNFSADEGYLVFEEVGAPEYGNVRTAVGVLIDGYDSYNDVDLDNVEPVE